MRPDEYAFRDYLRKPEGWIILIACVLTVVDMITRTVNWYVLLFFVMLAGLAGISISYGAARAKQKEDQ